MFPASPQFVATGVSEFTGAHAPHPCQALLAEARRAVALEELREDMDVSSALGKIRTAVC